MTDKHLNQTKRKRGRPRLSETDGRDDIKRAALVEFARYGYGVASIDKIAETAGVAKPLIHYHFGSKEELWKQAVSEAYEEFRAEAMAFASQLSKQSPEMALDMFASQIVQFAADRVALIQLSIDETRQGGDRADWLKASYLVPLQKLMAIQVSMVLEERNDSKVIASHLIPSIFGAIVFPFVDSDVIYNAHGVDVFTEEYITEQANFVRMLLRACLSELR